MFFNKNNAIKRDANFFGLIMFFGANVSEVKLHNISLLFNQTSH